MGVTQQTSIVGILDRSFWQRLGVRGELSVNRIHPPACTASLTESHSGMLWDGHSNNFTVTFFGAVFRGGGVPLRMARVVGLVIATNGQAQPPLSLEWETESRSGCSRSGTTARRQCGAGVSTGVKAREESF